MCFEPLFGLENAIPSPRFRPGLHYPVLGSREVNRLINSFQKHPNSWHPTIPWTILDSVRVTAVDAKWDYSCNSCLALLVLALGAESTAIEAVFDAEATDEEEEDSPGDGDRGLGRTLFDGAFKTLSIAYSENTATATHCLHLAAYVDSLRRL